MQAADAGRRPGSEEGDILKATGDLSTQILQKVAPRAYQEQLAITVFTGMETKLAVLRHGWATGTRCSSSTSAFASLLSDCERCVRDGNQEENAMIGKEEPGPTEYLG
ncbi:hypothetical protein F4780DRAFT_570175 [Xylariomycetidae sp. FL0641]|nr:hypothetical protein F4780DRAFT_570175 [Xylariomycetidae sp. FL0641]